MNTTKKDHPIIKAFPGDANYLEVTIACMQAFGRDNGDDVDASAGPLDVPAITAGGEYHGSGRDLRPFHAAFRKEAIQQPDAAISVKALEAAGGDVEEIFSKTPNKSVESTEIAAAIVTLQASGIAHLTVDEVAAMGVFENESFFNAAGVRAAMMTMTEVDKEHCIKTGEIILDPMVIRAAMEKGRDVSSPALPPISPNAVPRILRLGSFTPRPIEVDRHRATAMSLSVTDVSKESSGIAGVT
jgi:hypothetical protein